MKTKRLIISTLCGILFGIICSALASSGPEKMPWPVIAQIIASRTLMGIAIGMSAFTIAHWSLNGIIMGLLFSAPLAFSVLLAPESPDMSNTMICISTFVIGMVYGFLTELITSVLFKAKAG